MFTTALEAAQLVSPYVGLQFPDQKEDLYRILTLVNDKIWKEGTWWGMDKEFFVKTRKGPDGEYYIVCPPDYDILKAVNLDGKPTLNRDKWFQFHKNGCGSIAKNCNWSRDVVDLGEYATINDIYTGECRPNKILIGACFTGEEDGKSEVKRVRIQGEWDRGGKVWTYEKNEFPKNRIEFLNEEQKFQPIFGARIALTNKIRFIENVWWKSISSITKDITVNPVEVYAIHPDKTLQLLAVIQPHQKSSRHRRYLVPSSCCKKSCSCKCKKKECSCPPAVHAIFKVSRPEQITYDTQPIYTEDRESLISLSIGINQMFDKKDPQKSIPFILNGVKNLEDDNRENQTDDVFPIQVVGPYVDDIPEIIRHYSH